MKATERIDSIISLVPYNGFILVKDLASRFNVTEETIRRDLGRIMEMNIGICKVHGGAYRVSKGDETSPFSFRATMLTEVKARFADYCVNIIKPESCVMLDSSTTSLFIARMIKAQRLRVTIVTNSLPIVMEFEDDENSKVICLGGQLRKRNESLVGFHTVELLRKYCADCCFISPTSIDLQHGLTDHSELEAAVRKAMLEQSSSRFLVADHTKFGWSSINVISLFKGLDAIISDVEPSAQWSSILGENGISWHCL
ncbi:MAG: DeoR/GlpR family DNA-binding transcription regulator [Sphaerochaetaceae bacterium]|jgi:DeoR/GlpR family transcriptional regulator of sugar metabolism|nr:DeoR/GlpR family DNA-binding transcription regulator [Sphaerochaetaceae bacterium]